MLPQISRNCPENCDLLAAANAAPLLAKALNSDLESVRVAATAVIGFLSRRSAEQRAKLCSAIPTMIDVRPACCFGRCLVPMPPENL